MKKIYILILLSFAILSCEKKAEFDNIVFESIDNNNKPFIDVNLEIFTDNNLKSIKRGNLNEHRVEVMKFYSALKRCYNSTTEINGLFYPTIKSSKDANVSESVYHIYVGIINNRNSTVLKMREQNSTYLMNMNRKRPVHIKSFDASMYSDSNMRQLIGKYLLNNSLKK